MPLFFVCSGYFFKDIESHQKLTRYYKRKMQGLYLPYLKWSLFFLLFHNIFVLSNIIHDYTYDFNDYAKQLFNTCLMTDYEILIRPFWFIKELLLSSILIATITLFRNRYITKITNEILAVVFLLLTVIFKYHSFIIPALGDISIISLSITYIYIGNLYRKYEKRINLGWAVCIICFTITLIGSLFFIGDIDMRFTTVLNILPYYFFSITGIIFIFGISKYTDLRINDQSYLYYIGNHTMYILALHLLALKLGNFIKLQIYAMPIESLASHTIIYDNNDYFWIIYIIIGVSFPLFIEYLYIFLKK